MIPLCAELKVQNRTLKQIRREGQVAMYELYGANGMLYGFEVVIIKIAKATHAFGKDYPERELYPSNEDWGRLAWSYGRDHRDLADETFARCLTNASKRLEIDDLVSQQVEGAG